MSTGEAWGADDDFPILAACFIPKGSEQGLFYILAACFIPNCEILMQIFFKQNLYIKKGTLYCFENRLFQELFLEIVIKIGFFKNRKKKQIIYTL